jgi:hypothetical protein
LLNINLIAERRSRKLREMMTLRWSMIGLVLLLLLMLGFNITAWFEWQSNQKDLTRQANLLVDLKVEYEVLQEINQKISEKGPIVNLLDQVRISEQSWMIILADISQVIPQDANIEGIVTMGARDGMRLRFSGQALDQETVGVFMEAFSQQTLWASPADLSQISISRNAGDSKRVRFDFSVPVRGMLGGELR